MREGGFKINRLYYYFCAVSLVIILIISTVLSWHIRGWFAKYDSEAYSFDDIPQLNDKFIIVTGANAGIGKVV